MADGFRTRVSIVQEVTYGVTPATPTMLRLPVTGHSMADRVSQTPSNIINQTRNVEDMVRTGRGATGTLPCELRHSPSGEGLNAALFALLSNSTVAAAATVASCTTTAAAKTITRAAPSFITDGFAVGDIIRLSGGLAADMGYLRVTNVAATTLTVDRVANFTGSSGNVTVTRGARATNALSEQSFTVEVAHLDLQRAHIYRGCVFNSASINLAVNQLATVSFQMEAKDSIVTGNTGTTDVFITGATYAAMTFAPTLDPIGVQEVQLSNFAGVGQDVPAQSVALSMANNIRPREQLAALGPVSMSRGLFTASANLSAYFDTQDDQTTFLSNTATDLWLVTTDANGRGWSVAMPQAKITDLSVPVSGPGADIFRAMTVAGYRSQAQDCTLRLQRWD
jgi:hypothetical protein